MKIILRSFTLLIALSGIHIFASAKTALRIARIFRVQNGIGDKTKWIEYKKGNIMAVHYPRVGLYDGIRNLFYVKYGWLESHKAFFTKADARIQYHTLESQWKAQQDRSKSKDRAKLSELQDQRINKQWWKPR